MLTIALHHILLKSPLLAQDLVKELELGADFEELAREYSACPSGKQGGFAGYHPQDSLPLELVEALALHDSDKSFSGPVETHYGFHLLKPVGEKPKLAIHDDNAADFSPLNQDDADISDDMAVPLSSDTDASQQNSDKHQPHH
jgi:peptidyl-prolyl cis-trans isomerase C